MKQTKIKKGLSLALCGAMMLSTMAVSAKPMSQEGFAPKVTYQTTVTNAERDAIHKAVDGLSGYVGDMVSGDGTYDPNTLIGGLADGSSYNSISYGSGAAGSVPTTYPFPVPNSEKNFNEYDRKVAKLSWVKELAENLGFENVVQRQEDKYVYVEIGDPDAPEMIMALSHLDSPTASNNKGNPGGNLDRWVTYDGELDPTAYYNPYVRDGWLYGAGVQDDSGPTLATLFAAKALMDSGVDFDRRIRIVMGAYEDGSPGVPSTQNTLNYMDIPYYTQNPGFYDNWAYKSLNREETPIAAYTSDSRFPVVVGNSKATTPTLTMDLSADIGKAFALTGAKVGVTLRANDPTLKDIVYGSAAQVASRAIFTLNAAGVDQAQIDAFIDNVKAAATKVGWLPAAEDEIPKVQIAYADDVITIEVNTGVTAEYPTPQYGANAIVWEMFLINSALEQMGITDLQLNKAAAGITDLFFRDCLEGEAYIGKYMGIPTDLLRNNNDGTANLTFALMGNINNEDMEKFPIYTEDGLLKMVMQVRSMHTNAADYTTAMDTVLKTWNDKGFTWTDSKLGVGKYTAFSNPTLYLSHDNPLTALQYGVYMDSIKNHLDEFPDASSLLDITYPVGTTGGTLASDFRNKMTAFGAVIPGNERWWHSANERISVQSIIEMTKLMADGMLEMARYTDDVGAQLMWADIEGYNANRAELDLLDVTVGTYQDASADVLPEDLNGQALMGATKFDIPRWRIRGNNALTITDEGYKSGACYLSTSDADCQANTFVLPMALEFKVEKPQTMSTKDWRNLMAGDLNGISFNILNDGEVVTLTAPKGEDAAKYFSVREGETSDYVYVSVNLAITDAEYTGVETVLADSKTDLFDLNDQWLANNENPFPERGAVEERGFFLFGDGEKDARFQSPDAIFVTGKTNSGNGNLKYSVTVAETENGTVKVNKTTSTKNGKVSVTVTADKGYKVSEVTVVDRMGNPVAVSGKNGKFSFTMPASSVTVTAQFVAGK